MKIVDFPQTRVVDVTSPPAPGGATSRKLIDVRQRQPNQTIMPAGHLATHRRAYRFSGAKPRQIQSLLGRLAITVNRDYVSQRHRVLARVVEAAAIGVGEVLHHRER